MVKDLGTELEQLLVDRLWEYRYEPIEAGPTADRFHEFLEINRLRSAVFTTAGGTNEVLRILVSRQLSPWAASRKGWALRTVLAETAHGLASKALSDPAGRSVPRGVVDGASVLLCRELATAGFLGVSVPERVGGAGGSLADLLEVVRGVSYAGLSTPLIDGALQAGWLLAQAGVDLDWSDEFAVAGIGDLVLLSGDKTVSGTLENLGWAQQASTVVLPVADGGRLCVVTIDSDDLAPEMVNTAGEPMTAPVRLDAVAVRRVVRTRLAYREAVESLTVRAALARSIALAAALQRTAEIAIEYAAQREQFGQPINRFQAVQAHLTRLASEAQRVAVVVDAAQAALGDADDPTVDPTWAAAARTLAGEAAMVAGRTAHQVHGALGVTMEYPLQRFTRRLWEWAAADRTSQAWAARLGAQAASRPGAAWELITGTWSDDVGHEVEWSGDSHGVH
jgi:acyl-CoA dehydrogenase